MKKIIFMGAIGCGKTSLCQAIYGEELRYSKTQALSFYPEVIDTPGEFILHRQYYNALIVSAADAQVIGLIQSIMEVEQIFSPGFGAIFPKPVIGIISKMDMEYPKENLEIVRQNLKTAGAEKIFEVSSMNGMGIKEIITFLEEMAE
ncbi:EutP/PduV family microcompartment system protein [Enterococcus mediterraneensis]|uniref:EutP/PduV family microcompartment system protein n=1 Tax=Enterococcus mediterraneensis TaxID=2364791 RepID=UPI000F06100C|nr:EutP/PduV family microcompartment system protein [Enterococcus mediterraneensis]